MKRSVKCPHTGSQYYLTFCQERRERGDTNCLECTALKSALKAFRNWSPRFADPSVVSDLPKSVL